MRNPRPPRAQPRPPAATPQPPATAPQPAALQRAVPGSAEGWRTLPPLRPTPSPTPPTNPVQRFSDTLVSWQNPSYLAPLGHTVSPTEPAGLVDATTPVLGATPTAALTQGATP